MTWTYLPQYLSVALDLLGQVGFLAPFFFPRLMSRLAALPTGQRVRLRLSSPDAFNAVSATARSAVARWQTGWDQSSSALWMSSQPSLAGIDSVMARVKVSLREVVPTEGYRFNQNPTWEVELRGYFLPKPIALTTVAAAVCVPTQHTMTIAGIFFVFMLISAYRAHRAVGTAMASAREALEPFAA